MNPTGAGIDAHRLRHWAASIRGDVIVPGDSAYDAARQVWNRAVDRRPAAIVRCADAGDVARTIELARASSVALAVRSGGHSQAGHGVCDGGLVIDLAAFRAIRIDPEERIAHVAAGARVRDVVDATSAHGLLTPMGGCPDVGVGGLTLGGGENFFMARYGAVVDNVLAADVVTADGLLLRASESENADLFWAIRGGGGNFGVVTAFEYRLHAIGEVLSGQMRFPVASARDVLLRYRELMADAPDELTTSGGLTLMPDGPAFFVALCYCGGRSRGDQFLRTWRSSLRPEDDNIKWGPFTADLVVPAAPSAGSGLFLPELNDPVIEILAEASRRAPRAASAVWNDFHGAVTRTAEDATAFALRQRGCDLFVSVPWDTDDQRCAADDWIGALVGALRRHGHGVYVNNLNSSEAARVEEAYGANYARLARVKARYDAANFFAVNHNIAPAGD